MNMDLKRNIVCSDGLNFAGSGWGQILGCFEHDHVTLGSLKGGEFLVQCAQVIGLPTE
jgi:hypothetical protein